MRCGAGSSSSSSSTRRPRASHLRPFSPALAFRSVFQKKLRLAERLGVQPARRPGYRYLCRHVSPLAASEEEKGKREAGREWGRPRGKAATCCTKSPGKKTRGCARIGPRKSKSNKTALPAAALSWLLGCPGSWDVSFASGFVIKCEMAVSLFVLSFLSLFFFFAPFPLSLWQRRGLAGLFLSDKSPRLEAGAGDLEQQGPQDSRTGHKSHFNGPLVGKRKQGGRRQAAGGKRQGSGSRQKKPRARNLANPRSLPLHGMFRVVGKSHMA